MFGDFIFPNSQNVSVFELVASLDEGLETGVFYGVIGTMNGTSKQVRLLCSKQRKGKKIKKKKI
jgi:uncharacterized membrane protein